MNLSVMWHKCSYVSCSLMAFSNKLCSVTCNTSLLALQVEPEGLW